MSLRLFFGSEEVFYNSSVYSGGEVSVKIVDLINCNFMKGSIYATLHSSNDVMELLLVTDAIRREQCNAEIKLVMPYVPYARQDRVCAVGEALSIKVFCDLINSQGYSQVEVHDPHSDVLVALLNNCKVNSQSDLFINMHEVIRAAKTVLVSPDAGATKKIFELAKRYGFSRVVRADKSRDIDTKAITGTVIYSEPIGDKDFLIVDDISDYGGSFIPLAKALRPLTTGKIILYVTHCIMPEGLDKFRGVIDEFYTAHPFNKKYKPYTNLLAVSDAPIPV